MATDTRKDSKANYRRAIWLVLALAAIYFMAVFGYDVGKDMAARDNARDAMRSSGAATQMEAP